MASSIFKNPYCNKQKFEYQYKQFSSKYLIDTVINIQMQPTVHIKYIQTSLHSLIRAFHLAISVR